MDLNSGDLSSYELIRLENIRRNAEFLESIGLGPAANPLLKPPSRPKIPRVVDRLPSKLSKRKQPDAVLVGTNKLHSATRRSARLANEEIEELGEPVPVIQEAENKENEDGFTAVDYDSMPVLSEELDDNEFLVYTKLRDWRLKKSIELDIEPYKIAQNRTFAELIRRRRNNQHWATNIDDNSAFAAEVMECWGIGPAKAQEGGFADDFIHILEDKECKAALATSRLIQTQSIVIKIT